MQRVLIVGRDRDSVMLAQLRAKLGQDIALVRPADFGGLSPTAIIEDDMFNLHVLRYLFGWGRPRVNFTASYGNNPKSNNGSYARNSNAAAQKRAARKRRNIAKQAR